eukprot:11194834-Lingulodinium_polyedra.AAC.1
MDCGLRVCGLPSHSLWVMLLSPNYTLIMDEDNQAMMRCIETGRGPTMRYIHRTHRVSVAWL